MAEHRIPASTKGEEAKHMTIVPSFTTPEKSYLVRGETCTCGAYVHRGLCRKHVALAEAFERIEALPFGDGVKGMHSERLLRLARRIYSRPRATETVSESYDLLLAVLRERYATERMRERAKARHDIVMSRVFGKAVA